MIEFQGNFLLRKTDDWFEKIPGGFITSMPYDSYVKI